jgi:hypothetical protein
VKRNVICMKCGGGFLASRSDAVSCAACHSKRRAEWQKANRHRRKDIHRRLREQAYAGYGGCCACCGEWQFEFLAIDHVNGGGGKDRKKCNTYQIARRVINAGFPREYRVLCHNCNSAIGWFGACPHEQIKKRTA